MLDFRQLQLELQPPANPSRPRGRCNPVVLRTVAGLGEPIAHRRPSYEPGPRIACCRQREHRQGKSRGDRCFRGYRKLVGRGGRRCRLGLAGLASWRPCSRQSSHASTPAWIEAPPIGRGLSPREPQRSRIRSSRMPWRRWYSPIADRPAAPRSRSAPYRCCDRKQLAAPRGADRAVRPQPPVRASAIWDPCSPAAGRHARQMTVGLPVVHQAISTMTNTRRQWSHVPFRVRRITRAPNGIP